MNLAADRLKRMNLLDLEGTFSFKELFYVVCLATHAVMIFIDIIFIEEAQRE